MATNPMLQAVMLFQHHQTTTPFAPVPPGTFAARDVTKEKQPGPDPDEEEEEENNEEEQKKGEEENG